MIQLTEKDLEEIVEPLQKKISALEDEVNSLKHSLQMYMRWVFDDAKSKELHQSIIDLAIARNMPQDFIDELRNDLEVGT
jgi:dephospho-CoA kinase